MSGALTRAALLAGAAACVVGATLAGVWLTTGFGTVALPPAPAEQSASAVAGPPRLSIDKGALSAGGIAIAPLRAASFRPEQITYARVIDPSALFSLQSRLSAARAALVAAEGQAELSQQEYARDESLFAHHQSVSQQALLTSKTAKTTDAQRLEQAQAALDDLRATLQAQFGPAFAEPGKNGSANGSTGGDSSAPPLGRLRSGAAALVAVTLPAGLNGTPPAQITLEAESGESVAATYLSPAPAGNPKAPGRVAYYLAARAMQIGSQPMAQVPLAAPRAGVFLPEEAVIWFGGQRWVYVADSKAAFTRRALPEAGDLQPAPGGYVAASAFKPGERIVTRGAELLLSQEMRPKNIKTECPDPPECDG